MIMFIRWTGLIKLSFMERKVVQLAFDQNKSFFILLKK